MGTGMDSQACEEAKMSEEAAVSDFSVDLFHRRVMACILDLRCVLTFWNLIGMTGRGAAESQQPVIVMDQK